MASFLKAHIKPPFELTCVGGRKRTCPVPRDADLYIIAVSDRAIGSVAEELKGVEGLVVHTAGSVPMDVLSQKRRGVLYPLQTLSKQRLLPASRVPFYIEASQAQDLELLRLLAESMGSEAEPMDSQRRKYLHLPARHPLLHDASAHPRDGRQGGQTHARRSPDRAGSPLGRGGDGPADGTPRRARTHALRTPKQKHSRGLTSASSPPREGNAQ